MDVSEDSIASDFRVEREAMHATSKKESSVERVLGSIFDPEDGGSKLLLNVSQLL
jgi:fructose/tagatose bisphosphate aldolase